MTEVILPYLFLDRKMADRENVHKQEVEVLNSKLQASQLERQSITSQMVELSAENKRFQTEVKIMNRSVK